ncbi:hypothetical protein SKAU_G00120880 [Synaphobranchus kaupii]|uniref:Dynein axonemal light chain 4 n=2 Tax=Anguilliformes TaxID=7933 RepID=A0A9Q1J089_SYNKA|nr:hypothetical protein SKAU_G00120880 [Synaphobranchus kaupii]
MLAFLGAVICIIASVYPGSSTSAHLSLADNQSLSPDAVSQSLSPGSVARAGSLGALHGSESTEAGGLGVGLEAPTFNELSNSGGIGSGGRKQFSFSRLICTPVPAGECKSNNLQQQADEPSLYAGEDLGYFRTTAEQLRQTVLQQKDQILMDQGTIRELTGKLSECESGLEERSAEVERSVGLWGDNRRLMAGDDVQSLALAQMQTARAVEELERAILQLKDRIEKLESELGPLAHNLTEMGAKGLGSVSGTPRRLGGGSAVAGGGPGGRAGEEDRAAGEGEGGAPQADTGATIRRSIRGSAPCTTASPSWSRVCLNTTIPMASSCPFPLRTNYMYGKVKRAVSEMYALTACLWLRAREGGHWHAFLLLRGRAAQRAGAPAGPAQPCGATHQRQGGAVAPCPCHLTAGSTCALAGPLRDGVWKALPGGAAEGAGGGLGCLAPPFEVAGCSYWGRSRTLLGGRFDASQALHPSGPLALQKGMAETVDPKKEEADYKRVHSFPLIRQTDMPEEMRVETMELCVTACEKFSTNNESAAKMIKESMDKKFGSSWHVVIGEGFGFEVTHEVKNLLYMFFGGSLAVCVWKCS